MKSLRQIAKEAGVSHSTLSKIANGKIPASKKTVEKLLASIGGVNIPQERYTEILQMLDSARFPAKFGQAQRTAAYLYDLIATANKQEQKS